MNLYSLLDNLSNYLQETTDGFIIFLVISLFLSPPTTFLTNFVSALLVPRRGQGGG